MKMNGRVALITGGAGGLGQAIALRMASEGACVVICDVNEEALETTRGMIEQRGAQCLALRCDVSSSAEVNAMFDRIDARCTSWSTTPPWCRINPMMMSDASVITRW
mgnify:CR=1 FL=1